MRTDEVCPCCENEMTYKVYYEDWHIVETVKSCSCGYKHIWSYGSVFEEFPEGYEEEKEEDEEDERFDIDG